MHPLTYASECVDAIVPICSVCATGLLLFSQQKSRIKPSTTAVMFKDALLNYHYELLHNKKLTYNHNTLLLTWSMQDFNITRSLNIARACHTLSYMISLLNSLWNFNCLTAFQVYQTNSSLKVRWI